MTEKLPDLLNRIRRCTLCAAALPLGPKPVLQASASSRILIIGQAPGLKVHQTGIPWNDPSGQRLRAWLEMDRTQFYDVSQVAIVPMAFCYPGRGSSGDNPPPTKCALEWHQRLMQDMPAIKLTLLVGQYAQQFYLQDKRSLTDRVRHWQDYLPRFIPLPHPSPRNNIWLARHRWFEPQLEDIRKQIRDSLNS